MMKKALFAALALTVSLGLGACQSSGNTSDRTGGGPGIVGMDQGGENQGGPDQRGGDQGGGNQGNAQAGGMAARMTPPGATVVASVPGMVALESTASMSDVVGFYDTALAQVGAKGEKTALTSVAWAFDGTYDGGKHLEVSVSDQDGIRFVGVFWDE